MTEHYNTPADFIVAYTAIGFTVVMLIYLPVTLIGIVKGYLAAATKPPKTS